MLQTSAFGKGEEPTDSWVPGPESPVELRSQSWDERHSRTKL